VALFSYEFSRDFSMSYNDKLIFNVVQFADIPSGYYVLWFGEVL
jgi:hypothetical protein